MNGSPHQESVRQRRYQSTHPDRERSESRQRLPDSLAARPTKARAPSLRREHRNAQRFFSTANLQDVACVASPFAVRSAGVYDTLGLWPAIDSVDHPPGSSRLGIRGSQRPTSAVKSRGRSTRVEEYCDTKVSTGRPAPKPQQPPGRTPIARAPAGASCAPR